MMFWKNRKKLLVFMVVALLFLVASTTVAWADSELDEVRLWMEQLYIEEIDWSQVDDSSLDSFFRSIGDPYTNYLSPGEFDEFISELDGTSFGGIGIHIESVNGYVTVVAPIKDTPAYHAGLKPQDKIIQVNGLDIVGVPVSQASDLIRGEPGTVVELTILRGEELLLVPIIREIITIKNIEGRMLDQDIGYIRITSFGSDTAFEMEKLINELEREGARGYLLDLRYNGGGYLESAIDIASLLISAGPIVHVVDRSQQKRTFYSDSGSFNKPLVVLINEGSASASEILAAAIQENKVGYLVGATSFGKASVQTLVSLQGGGFLKATTAYYLTPDGNNINGVGINPDYPIEDYHEQLEKAQQLIAQWIAEIYGGQSETRVILSIGENSSFLYNDRTYIPVRFVSERLGLDVFWNQAERKIYVYQGDKTIVLEPNSNNAGVNGTVHSFDSPVLMRDNASYIPLRFLINLVGGQVNWDETSKRITIFLAD